MKYYFENRLISTFEFRFTGSLKNEMTYKPSKYIWWRSDMLKLTSESLIYFEVRVIYIQKQPPRGVLKKRCSENMQKILALRHGCSPVNLLHIFRTPFPRNTSGWLLLYICITRFKNLRYNSVWKLLTLFPGNDFPVLITKCFMLDVKGFLDSPLHAIH